MASSLSGLLTLPRTRRTARPCVHVNAARVGSRSAASVRTEFSQKSSVVVVTRCLQSVKGANTLLRCGNLINEATMKTADRLYSEILIFFTSTHCAKRHHEAECDDHDRLCSTEKKEPPQKQTQRLMKLTQLTNATAQGPMGCFHPPNRTTTLPHRETFRK